MARRTLSLIPLIAALLPAAIIPGHYVVELSTPSVSEQFAGRGRHHLEDSGSIAHRSRVHGEQQQMRTRLEYRRARVFGSVDTIANAMFVELAGDDAKAQLEGLPCVKRVVPMREFRRAMDHAVLVHRVADVWARIGDGRGGEGIKVAILDTGVESSHPAFQDSGLTAPDGFPRTTSAADEANTNGKVIVARSYVTLLPRRDSDTSARDRVGHGTALASIVAGVRTTGPLATIAGVAPKAWIGNYKVFGTPGVNDATNDAAVLKAIEDAVSDGMDIINLSLGADLAPRLDDDLEVQAIERAARAGVVVVVSAGNNGPGLNTLASPGTAPSAITVGAVSNDRTFGASADVPGLGAFLARPGNGPNPTVPVTALLTDVASLDNNGLACASLAAGSLSRAIALILRGDCTFETKLDNAQRAGAAAALVYAAEASPEAINMSVGAATLPAEMISFAGGAAIKLLLAQGQRVATLSFTVGPFAVPSNRRSSFSSAGPSVDAAIKPDLVAAGSDIYTATQRLDRNGDMYSADGFVLVSGTSFSAPIVAGAVALIKSARPGLTADQLRSLIIDNTANAYTGSGELAGVQVAGAGSLDALAALNATVTANPVSLGFGPGGADPRLSRSLLLTNLGTAQDTFFLEANVRTGGDTGPAPASTVVIGARASVNVPVTWNASGLTPGPHEGFIAIRSSNTGQIARVPYWYAVTSSTPEAITVLTSETTGRRNGVVRDAVLFRVLDASGLNFASAELPAVTVLAGDGVARPVVSYDSEIPGMYGLTVQLGPVPGVNTFRIQAGETSITVNITGQ